MLPAIKGRQLLDVLSNIEEPALLTDIAGHVASAQPKQARRKIMNDVKSALNVGVQYGYIEKLGNRYFLADEKATQTSGEGESSESEAEEATKPEEKLIVESLSPDDCYDNRRGRRMSRRGMSESRRMRSRSRLAPRKSSRRRRSRR